MLGDGGKDDVAVGLDTSCIVVAVDLRSGDEYEMSVNGEVRHANEPRSITHLPCDGLIHWRRW